MQRGARIVGSSKWVPARLRFISWLRWVGNSDEFNGGVVHAFHNECIAVRRPPVPTLPVHFFCSDKLGNAPRDIKSCFARKALFVALHVAHIQSASAHVSNVLAIWADACVVHGSRRWVVHRNFVSTVHVTHKQTTAYGKGNVVNFAVA